MIRLRLPTRGLTARPLSGSYPKHRDAVVTIDDVRAFANTLPRSSECRGDDRRCSRLCEHAPSQQGGFGARPR
jgi:hypothetical protein